MKGYYRGLSCFLVICISVLFAIDLIGNTKKNLRNTKKNLRNKKHKKYKGKAFTKPYILSNISENQAETKNHAITESKIVSRLEEAFQNIHQNEQR